MTDCSQEEQTKKNGDLKKVKREIKQRFFQVCRTCANRFWGECSDWLGKRGRSWPWGWIESSVFSSLKLKTFTFQDLFISGDVDEVLSRRALHQLKWCQVKEDVITGDSFKNPVQTIGSTWAIRCPMDASWEPWTSQITYWSPVLIVIIASGALWMPLGNLERALRTEFPVYGRPHSFSLPTIYKVLR